MNRIEYTLNNIMPIFHIADDIYLSHAPHRISTCIHLFMQIALQQKFLAHRNFSV